ncbi:MAG: hypothetical protein LBK42_04420 [Propionibacteriaceae bacterium]|jgi:hypothetical protein|nr:hypothetical protein [Propionibacteriaceae bacterium]
MTTSDNTARPAIGRRTSLLVAVFGGWSALVGFICVTWAVRLLPQAEGVSFQFFWAALFAAFGVLNGLSLEMVRAVSAAHPDDRTPPGRFGRVGPIAGSACLLVAVVGAATLPAWHPLLNPPPTPNGWAFAGAVVAGAAGFAVHATVTGAMMGARRWGLYFLFSGTESTLRLGLVAACALSGRGLVDFAWAVAGAEFACLVILALSPPARQTLRLRLDAHGGVVWRRLLGALGGQGASALLVVGFPLLLSLTTPTAVMAASGALLYSLILTRTPLMVPLNVFQGVAVAYFTRSAHRSRPARRLLGLVALIGVVGAGLAWLVGPWLLRVISGGYELSGLVLAGLTLGATSVALLTLTGVLCQSAASYGAYLTGWLTAVVATVIVLVLPGPVAARAVVGLVVGPLLGAAVHLFRLLRAGRPATAT